MAMEKWYIGVDGGGTKTAFAIAAADGVPVSTLETGGCSYQMLGADGTVARIAAGVDACLSAQQSTRKDCAGCCIGLPCFGEDAEKDKELSAALIDALSPICVHIANDVEVAWAGALDGQPGIHLVSGTGAIAFGKDDFGKTARCGGWNEFFGDEGSCYWVGRQAMSQFTKEADGRESQGALYEIVREALALQDDFQFIPYVLRELAPYRDRVAAFQTYLLQAAMAGDAAAIKIYEAAAAELALLVKALLKKLSYTQKPVPVSYTGGLFHAGNLIIQPLQRELSGLDCMLKSPSHSAVEGALKLVIEKYKEI